MSPTSIIEPRPTRPSGCWHLWWPVLLLACVTGFTLMCSVAFLTALDDFPCESRKCWRDSAAQWLGYLIPGRDHVLLRRRWFGTAAVPPTPPVYRVMLQHWFPLASILPGETSRESMSSIARSYRYECVDASNDAFTHSYFYYFSNERTLLNALPRTGVQLILELVAGITLYVAALVLLVRFDVFLHAAALEDARQHMADGPGFDNEQLVEDSGFKRLLQQHRKERVTPRTVEDGDLCPVCFEPLQHRRALDEVEHCLWGCGKAVHTECMKPWLDVCRVDRSHPTCVYCKAQWSPRETAKVETSREP